MLDANVNLWLTVGLPPSIGVAQRINAAAVLLLVKFFALSDLLHSLRAALLAPIELPIFQTRIATSGTDTAAIDLIHIFPARDA